jgi:hypothetical protein
MECCSASVTNTTRNALKIAELTHETDGFRIFSTTEDSLNNTESNHNCGADNLGCLDFFFFFGSGEIFGEVS